MFCFLFFLFLLYVVCVFFLFHLPPYLLDCLLRDASRSLLQCASPPRVENERAIAQLRIERSAKASNHSQASLPAGTCGEEKRSRKRGGAANDHTVGAAN